MKKRILSGFIAGFMAVCMLVLTVGALGVTKDEGLEIFERYENGEKRIVYKYGDIFEVSFILDNFNPETAQMVFGLISQKVLFNGGGIGIAPMNLCYPAHNYISIGVWSRVYHGVFPKFVTKCNEVWFRDYKCIGCGYSYSEQIANTAIICPPPWNC